MRKIYIFLLTAFFYQGLHAQLDGFGGRFTLGAAQTNTGVVPFWMRSDQFGSIPLSGTSATGILAVHRDYDSSKQTLVDWGASLEVRGDLGNNSRATLIEGYAKARLSIFELRAGRSKAFMGLVDSSLSSGAFSISGNALGIPNVGVSIPNYYTIKAFGGLFSVKGNFSYGWVGHLPYTLSDSIHSFIYYNQSSLYGRFGKEDWRFKLYAGFNHQVMWGGEKAKAGKSWHLNDLQTFEYAVIGKTYEDSKVGNHLGTFDLGMEYSFPGVELMAYHQFFYDEGALFHLANLRDGLNGISLTRTAPSYSRFKVKKIVLELFLSKNQAGYPWSKRTPSGDENYYNNAEFPLGWSYKGLGLGNPFITPWPTTRAGYPNNPDNYFNNNRVIAWYGGVEGSLNGIEFATRLSYSFNYGTFGTSIYGYSTGTTFAPPIYGIWKEVDQFSTWLKLTKHLNKGWQLGFQGALDAGRLLYNSGGAQLSVARNF
jgi:Capsule assembly protein Wzi